MRGYSFTIKFVIAGALLFALLSFNWDRTELEGRAFVVAIGIDASQEEGERFEVSMSIADVAAMEGEGGDADVAVLRVACGESAARAMGQVDAQISDKVYYGHTKAIVLGESILSDEALLREVIDTLSRKNEINIKCIVMATDKAAKDVLEAKPREQNLLGVYLSGFYNSNNANAAAAVVKLDLEGLTESLRSTGSAVIPKITLEEEDDKGEDESQPEIIISGVAVLRDFTLADYVPNEDMAGFLWIMADAAGSQVAVDAGGGHITFLVHKSKATLDFDSNGPGGRAHCRVKLRAEGAIEGARFMEDYLYDTETMRQLQNRFADKIHDEIYDILRIFQQDLGVDGFGLKERLRKKNRRLHERCLDEAHGDWQAAFENMAFAVDADVIIRNTGPVK
ncbi:MAG: Ger(x)C family spore germination protein [Clostridiales bacterium]|jgi:Ger(x)C family germination protein|nr:Ger(x)C family spore germination protein [Clostridiales bacterium]